MLLRRSLSFLKNSSVSKEFFLESSFRAAACYSFFSMTFLRIPFLFLSSSSAFSYVSGRTSKSRSRSSPCKPRMEDNKEYQAKGKNEVNLKDKTISYCFIILASSETRDSQILILHCDLSNSKQEPNMKVYYHCCSE